MITTLSCSTEQVKTKINIEPFVQTDDSRCGPATLKMILSYHGIHESEDILAMKCGHTYQYGCTNSDMERVLKQYGFRTYSKTNATLHDIRYWIDKDIPIIVDWFTTGVNPNSNDVADGHASIVVGIDDYNIQILDPENGRIRNLNHNDFLKVWFDWEGSNQIEDSSKMNIRYMLVAYQN